MTTRELGQLGKNNYFGDVSLITAERRAAYVTVTSDTATCLCMTKEVFDYVLMSTRKVLEDNQRRIAQTVLETMPLFQKAPKHKKKVIVP